MKKTFFLTAVVFLFCTLQAFSAPANFQTFNGTNQYMSIANHSDFNVTTSENLTVSFWVKATAYTSGQRYLAKRNLTISTAGDNRTGYEFWSGTTTAQCWAVNTPKSDAGNILSAYSNVGVTAGTWFHVAMVINRTDGKIYMFQNGTQVQASTADMSAWAVANNFDVLVGAGMGASGASNFLNGSIGNVRFYKRALNAAEIAADMSENNFTSLSVPLKDAAVGVYDFAPSNITGLTVADLSGKGHTGTLHNFPVNTANIANVTLTQEKKFTGRGNAQDVILKTNVVFGGTGETVNLTSLKLNLSGTTNLNDLTAIKIYSTGATDKFDFRTATGATLIGTVTPAEGDLLCNLSGSLTSGNNFLWITASVANNATEGNKIDASLLQITTADEIFNITNSSPEGAREILLARKLVYAPGDLGSTNYRIPALITAKDNNLVIATDKRKQNETDLPEDIDILINRSTDGGKTWGTPFTLALGTGKGAGYGDAALVKTQEAGGLICAYVGGDGLWQSVVESGKKIRSYIRKSTDNGQTWGAQVDITDVIFGKAGDAGQYWKASFFGSGNGLLTRTGRIMFVAAVREGTATSLNNYVIYSDDNGTTWNRSGRASIGGDEAKVVELNDGTILMSIRHSGSRWYNTSSDNGVTWGTVRSWSDIQANACNGDIIRYTSTLDGYDTNRLLHSVPNASGRENVTVFVSYDEGQTWGTKKSICPYQSVYSSLTILPDGTIGAYIEENPDGACSLYFLNFSLKWLTNGADQYLPANTQRVAKPEFSPVSGTLFNEGETANVTISCTTSGSTIYYTLDGTTPTTSSLLYQQAISFTQQTTIKAIAVADGMPQSLMAEATFSFPKYCTTEQEANRNDRYLNSISFSGGKQTFNSGTIEVAGRRNVYKDKTVDDTYIINNIASLNNVIWADPGSILKAAPNWTGEWMHAYVFVDYNQDKDFADAGETVAYNFYSPTDASSGTNSVGTTVQNNCGVTATNIPSFTIPTTTPAGVYRLRFKIDWNSLNPCGDPSIGNNGGAIVDFTLVVGTPLSLNVSSSNTVFGKAYIQKAGAFTAKNSSTSNHFGFAGNQVIVKAEPLAFGVGGMGEFINWTGTSSSVNSTYTFNMAGNTTLTANFADACVGLEKTELENTILVTGGKGQILIKNNGLCSVKVVNLIGQSIAEKQIEANAILPMPKGIFLVQITSNKAPKTYKVVVQ